MRHHQPLIRPLISQRYTLAVGRCLKGARLPSAYFHTPLASAVCGYATHLSGIALHHDSLQYVPGNIPVSRGIVYCYP